MARHQAEAVGAGISNFHTLSMMLLRALHIDRWHARELLQPLGGRFPMDKAQYELVVQRIRQYAHLVEHFPGNVNDALNPHRRIRTYLTDAEPVAPEESQVLLGIQDDPSRRPAGSLTHASSAWSDPASPTLFHHQTNDVRDPLNSVSGYFGYDEDDSGTDTDTESSTGELEYNYDDIANMPEEQAEQTLFYAYSYIWRLRGIECKTATGL